MQSTVLGHEPQLESKIPAPEASPAPSPKKGIYRLTSLDAFRGLTVFLMLLVNNIALDTQTPSQLMHAGWNGGVTIADLVFPWFLLCMGLAIPLSANSARKNGVPNWRHELRIVVRAALLIGIGCLLESATEKKPVFSMGVLQLIGFAYLIGTWLSDLPKKRRVIIAFVMLLGYGMALKYFPVPGAAPGSYSETVNWPTYMNTVFFGRFNLEGILSAIPTGALVLLGTVFGDQLLTQERTPTQWMTFSSISGLIMIVAGIIWNVSLPYSKALWTPAYILLSGGIGLLVLTLLYLTTDAAKRTKWATPLVIFGSNAIVAYAVPIFVKLTILSVWTVKTPTGPEGMLDHFLHVLKASMGNFTGGWIYTVSYIAIWGLVLWALYSKRIFIRV